MKGVVGLQKRNQLPTMDDEEVVQRVNAVSEVQTVVTIPCSGVCIQLVVHVLVLVVTDEKWSVNKVKCNDGLVEGQNYQSQMQDFPSDYTRLVW